ncbi:hypothetical protein IFR05_013314 [Cadophora sp. M221]|nr:hypothetical protein IFR05_013314 [Cadophora sp. M221]
MKSEPNRGVSLDLSKGPGTKQSQEDWRASLGIDTTKQIRVVELNHVRYQHSDIKNIVAFLEGKIAIHPVRTPPADRFMYFGFEIARTTEDHIYFNGYGSHLYDYVVVKGDEPKFLGGTFTVESYADLERASKMPNASIIQQLDHAPGGGQLVTIYDPGNFPINLIFGQNLSDGNKHEGFPTLLFNTEKEKARLGAFQRFTRGPAAVGHFGCTYLDFPKALHFYIRTFNLVPSDMVCVGPSEKPSDIAAFLHIERALIIHEFITAHLKFMILTLNCWVISTWLQNKGYKIVWGVGRHMLGSQIFDYWRDTSGFMIEHYADGDVVNKQTPVSRIPADYEMMQTWGPDRPSEWLG